jgi:hypothetical protein
MLTTMGVSFGFFQFKGVAIWPSPVEAPKAGPTKNYKMLFSIKTRKFETYGVVAEFSSIIVENSATTP